jgi:DHA2 family lincomycin resistance protein-like MFS transporter
VLYGLSGLGQSTGGDRSLPPWIPIGVGVGALAVFCWRQLRLQRGDRALLDLRPFTHRDFTVAVVVNALLFVCLLGVAAIMLPLYLQAVLHTSTFVSGLAVLPGGLILGLLGRPVGTLFDRFGARPLVIPGALAMAVSLWVFALLGPGSALVVVIAGHVLFMAGFGFMITPLMAESLGVLPDRLYSHGSAILATIQQLAGAFGTAVFISVATLASTYPALALDANGMHIAFLTGGFVGVLTLLASLFVRSVPATGDADS